MELLLPLLGSYRLQAAQGRQCTFTNARLRADGSVSGVSPRLEDLTKRLLLTGGASNSITCVMLAGQGGNVYRTGLSGAFVSGTSKPAISRLRVLLVIFALLVTACTGDTGSDNPPAGSSDSAPQGELVVAIETLGPMTWGPHEAFDENQITTHVFGEQLTTRDDETGEILPMLAESWELSDDEKTWTFKLRPDVPFHDDWGTVTAEDVKFTFTEAIKDVRWPFTPILQQAVDGDMEKNFEVVSDLEFRLHTSGQQVLHLPSVLCQCGDGPVIYSKRYNEESPDAHEHPIATGPWKFVSSSPGNEVELEGVADHWRSPPSFEKLTLREIPDASARLAGVQSGEIDLASLSLDLVNEARSAGTEINSVPDVANAYIILGGSFFGSPDLDEDAPWIQADNPEAGLAIRQAMSLAIDRQLILDRVMFGEGELTHFPVYQFPANESLVDSSWELPEYDLALAKEKLAEGGYPDGFPIDMPLFEQNAGSASVGDAIAGMWEELGLQAKRMPTDETVWDQKEVERDTAGAAWVHINGRDVEVIDAIGGLRRPQDDAKFLHSPTIDEIWEQMGQESDPEARFTLARELGQFWIDFGHPIPLFTVNGTYAAGPEIGGWTPIAGRDVVTGLDTVRPAN